MRLGAKTPRVTYSVSIDHLAISWLRAKGKEHVDEGDEQAGRRLSSPVLIPLVKDDKHEVSLRIVSSSKMSKSNKPKMQPRKRTWGMNSK
jgi:hypothetical protein